MTYKRYRTSRRGVRVLTFVAFLAMIMIGVEAGARAQQAAGKTEQQVVAQGVHISGADVSGMTAAQAQRAVRRMTSEPLTLTYGAQSWRFAPETLGADFQVDGAVRAALAAPEGTARAARYDRERASAQPLDEALRQKLRPEDAERQDRPARPPTGHHTLPGRAQALPLVDDVRRPQRPARERPRPARARRQGHQASGRAEARSVPRSSSGAPRTSSSSTAGRARAA